MGVHKNFFKYNPETDGDMTFNIDKALNDNWDLVNEGFQMLAEKPEAVNSKLVASSWNGNVYSLEAIYPAASYDIEIQPNGDSITTTQLDAWNAAQIVGSNTSNACKALGNVPTVDIPIIIKVTAK